jgi:hypothetical protein
LPLYLELLVGGFGGRLALAGAAGDFLCTLFQTPADDGGGYSDVVLGSSPLFFSVLCVRTSLM